MTISKICPICLIMFQTKNNATKFCSESCKQKHKILSKKKKCICAWCNKAFYTTRKRTYCTELCRMYANARVSTKQHVIKKAPSMSLSEVARLANACGLTYGKYVQQYGL